MDKLLQWEPFEKLLGTWAYKFKPFFDTGGFDNIYSVLKYDARRGIKRSPDKNNTFSAFELCSLENLKCIFLGLAPYATFIKNNENYIPISDGLAFSCSITNVEQPSLRVIWDAVFDDLKEEGKRYTNLSHWASQGVLLLNLALTAKKDKPESDIELWNPFMEYLFEEILNIERGLPIIYFGKQAAKFEKLSTPFIHYNKIIEHPSYSARCSRPMIHQNLFSWTNKILKETGRGQIEWIVNQTRYEELIDKISCPF